MNKKIVVLKFGSELVSNDNGVDYELLEAYAHNIELMVQSGAGVIIVTSGAVAAGDALVRTSGRWLEGYSADLLAQIGCASVMQAWELALRNKGLLAGGLLVTHHQLDSAGEGAHFVQHLKNAANIGVVSIVNENDALSDIELIKLVSGGDNDGLAQHIAVAVSASELIFFTKEGGIINEAGLMISEIDSESRIHVRIMLQKRAKTKKTLGKGRGGILAKFDAADKAASKGIDAKISGIDLLVNNDKSDSTTFSYAEAAQLV